MTVVLLYKVAAPAAVLNEPLYSDKANDPKLYYIHQ